MNDQPMYQIPTEELPTWQVLIDNLMITLRKMAPLLKIVNDHHGQASVDIEGLATRLHSGYVSKADLDEFSAATLTVSYLNSILMMGGPILAGMTASNNQLIQLKSISSIHSWILSIANESVPESIFYQSLIRFNEISDALKK